MTSPGSIPHQSESKDSEPLSVEETFLSAIIEMQRDLAEVELDSQIVMRIAAQRAMQLSNADGASFQLLPGDYLVSRFGAGIMEGQDGLKLRLAESLAGSAARTACAQYSPDCEADPRVDRAVTRLIGIRSLLIVPLSHGGQAFGVLGAVSRRPNAFDKRHISALTLMAGVVAASFSNAAELEIKKNLLAERTAALSSLRQSEQRFRNLFEHASDAVFVNGLDGRFLDVNILACQSLGYSRQELLSMSVQDVVADFDIAHAVQEWSQMEVGKPITVDRANIRRDGSTFPAEARIISIEYGDQMAILGIVRDVSERKRIEAVLRESQERFRSAFTHAAIGMALVSLDGRWLQVNQSLCRIVGYSEQELLVTDFQSITHPQDLDADLAFVRQLIAGDIPDYQMVKRYIHRQGQVVWVLLSVSLVRDETGKPSYFISQIQNITERRQAEEALRASEDEFRATFELAGIGKARTDLETGKLIRVNGKFCEMTGYSSEELCGRTLMSITHPEDIAMGVEARQRLLRGEITSVTNEKRFIRKDGKILWVIFSVAVIKDSSGRPNRAVATFQDITLRKRSEWLERDRRRVLEMVAKDLPIEQILEQLTEALQRQIEGSLAAVMALHDGEIRIHEISLPPAWREALQSRPVNLAANLAETIWNAKNGGVTFIETDPAWAQMRSSASEHGIKACWATAIHSTDGTPLGLTVVFSNEARHPTAAESQTLDMCAKLATICIDHYNATRRLSHLVRHDTLTGLPNRLMFEDRLHQALAVASRSGRQVALMLLDIDKFKAVNDTLGHQMGDHLLQQLSQRLRSQLRQADTMARLGGDEFVIVLPELISREGALVAAQKLVDCLVAPFDLAGQSIRATTSIGIAFFPDDGSEAVILQKKADAALYRAKERGRNRFSL